MSRLEDKFNKTISEYNDNVSDFHKFKFSDKEKAMFLNMMKEYGRECSQASLEKASETAQMNFHDGHFKTNTLTDYFMTGADSLKVSKESIANPENIIIL